MRLSHAQYSDKYEMYVIWRTIVVLVWGWTRVEPPLRFFAACYVICLSKHVLMWQGTREVSPLSLGSHCVSSLNQQSSTC